MDIGDSSGNRTRDTAVKGRCLNRLTMEPFGIRQRSTLPGSHPPSTIDAIELNFCVRYGNRWILNAFTTGFLSSLLKVYTFKTKQCLMTSSSLFLFNSFLNIWFQTLARYHASIFNRYVALFGSAKRYRTSPRAISINQLHMLPHFHL